MEMDAKEVAEEEEAEEEEEEEEEEEGETEDRDGILLIAKSSRRLHARDMGAEQEEEAAANGTSNYNEEWLTGDASSVAATSGGSVAAPPKASSAATRGTGARGTGKHHGKRRRIDIAGEAHVKVTGAQAGDFLEGFRSTALGMRLQITAGVVRPGTRVLGKDCSCKATCAHPSTATFCVLAAGTLNEYATDVGELQRLLQRTDVTYRDLMRPEIIGHHTLCLRPNLFRTVQGPSLARRHAGLVFCIDRPVASGSKGRDGKAHGGGGSMLGACVKGVTLASDDPRRLYVLPSATREGETVAILTDPEETEPLPLPEEMAVAVCAHLAAIRPDLGLPGAGDGLCSQVRAAVCFLAGTTDGVRKSMLQKAVRVAVSDTVLIPPAGGGVDDADGLGALGNTETWTSVHRAVFAAAAAAVQARSIAVQ